MPHLLRFDGVNDYVALDNPMPFQVNTDAYTIELDIQVNTYPTSGNKGLLGSGVSQSTGITLRAASPNLSLTMLHSGTFIFSSDANLIILGERHKYKLEHDADGNYRWYRDGNLHSSGILTYATPTNSIARIGMSSSTANWTAFDLYGLKFTGFGLAPIDIQPSLSNGTGNRLIDANGVNSGTLTSFPVDDSEWVLYGVAQTINAAATLTMPQMQVSGAAQAIANITSAAAVNMPQFQPAIAAAQSLIYQASAAASMPMFSASISANQVAPVINASIQFSMPQFTVKVNRGLADDVAGRCDLTMPQLSIAMNTNCRAGLEVGTFKLPSSFS